VRALADIPRQQQRPLPGLLYKPFDLPRILLLVEVGDRDIGTFAGEGERNGAADAAIAAGDKRHFALKTARALVAGLAEVRPRRHSLLDAGVGLGLGWHGGAGIFHHGGAPWLVKRYRHRKWSRRRARQVLLRRNDRRPS
jgi:hypothetical protein